jgi:hypothetical protein
MLVLFREKNQTPCVGAAGTDVPKINLSIENPAAKMNSFSQKTQ